MAPPVADSAVLGLGAAGWIAALWVSAFLLPEVLRNCSGSRVWMWLQTEKRWQTACCNAGEEGGWVGLGASSCPVLAQAQWLPGSAGLVADPVLGGALGPELNP